MRFQSGAKPETKGKFTPKIRGPKPEIEHEMPAQEHPVSVQPVEPPLNPEDPRKTGSGKPEQREMLEKSVKRDDAAREHPETVPTQHATGSFTDKKRRAG